MRRFFREKRITERQRGEKTGSSVCVHTMGKYGESEETPKNLQDNALSGITYIPGSRLSIARKKMY